MIKKGFLWLAKETNDPRYFQILYLGAFLLYGVSYLGWDADLDKYIYILVGGCLTQLTFVYFFSQKYSSIKSGMITALGLCLLLKTAAIWVSILAVFIAIASKFLVRVNHKHVFNPANLGIIVVLLTTDLAWVSPGQWGSSIVMWFFIGAAGLMMILKVGRLDTAITFMLVFGGLLFARQVIYLSWEPVVWLHQMSNGTLLLFAFFMITDPMTTPNHKYARIAWAGIIGISLFVASNFFYVQTAAIWILFFISPFTPLFDKLFAAPQYKWNSDGLDKQVKTTIQ